MSDRLTAAPTHCSPRHGSPSAPERPAADGRPQPGHRSAAGRPGAWPAAVYSRCEIHQLVERRHHHSLWRRAGRCVWVGVAAGGAGGVNSGRQRSNAFSASAPATLLASRRHHQTGCMPGGAWERCMRMRQQECTVLTLPVRPHADPLLVPPSLQAWTLPLPPLAPRRAPAALASSPRINSEHREGIEGGLGLGLGGSSMTGAAAAAAAS